MTDWQPTDDAKLLPRADRRIVAQADAAARKAALIADALAQRLVTLRDQLAGQPGAASYDKLPGARSVTWCWEHEADVDRCHTLGRLCTGQAIDTPDPTGETAIRPDHAARDHALVATNIAALDRATDVLVDVLARYTHRSPTKDEKRATSGNAPGCQSCARVKGHTGQPRYEPVAVRSTTARGYLPKPMSLCNWCYRFVAGVTRLPSVAELTAHHDGRRVRHSA